MHNVEGDQILKIMKASRMKESLEAQIIRNMDHIIQYKQIEFDMQQSRMKTDAQLKKRDFMITKVQKKIYSDKKFDANQLFKEKQKWFNYMVECSSSYKEISKKIQKMKTNLTKAKQNTKQFIYNQA